MEIQEHVSSERKKCPSFDNSSRYSYQSFLLLLVPLLRSLLSLTSRPLCIVSRDQEHLWPH
uniref:Uncharacterized protein n=1 Tax=Solanum tuberosum TaxID=4113 RepID=M1BXS0_SOLTU